MAASNKIIRAYRHKILFNWTLMILSVKNVVDMTSLEAFIKGMNPILSIIYQELIKDVHDRFEMVQ